MENVKEQSKSEKYSLLRNDFFVKRISGKFIFSSIISILFVYASSLIDTLLVGLYLHEDGLSAMSLVSPVYLVYYTVGATVGIGASIFASRALGKDDTEGYRKIFSCATYLLLAAALIMTALGYILFQPIITALCNGVTGYRRELVEGYMRYYIPGGGFTLLTYVPLYFLKTDGRPKVSSRLFTLSAIINVVFSWLFMSPLFNMGTGGASLATSISMGVVTVLGFIVMLNKKTELRLVKKCFSSKAIKEILVSGIPNGMNNLLNSARILLINTLIISTCSAALLPCYTVVRNVSDVLGSIIVGISSAIIPLVGVFFGERDYDGNRAVVRHAKKIGVLTMVPLVAVVCLIPSLLFSLFGITDTAIIEEGKIALPFACVGLVAAYINTLNIGYLTAIKHEAVATVLVVLRLFALLALVAFPLAYLFGSYGIWVSFSVAEVLTLISYLIINAVIRKKKPQYDRYLLDTSKEKDGNISFSVRNRLEDIVFATEQISKFCEDNDIDMRRSMRVSLAIEELLTFLNANCLSQDEKSYTDVRVCKLDDEVMVRFRYVGKSYDPVAYYKSNEFNKELEEELLGIKMITKSASLVKYSKTLGANNLMFVF